MNSNAIRRLRKKFIVISTLTYCVVMLFMGACINISNIVITRRQIYRVLEYMLDAEMEGREFYGGYSEGVASDDYTGASASEYNDYSGASASGYIAAEDYSGAAASENNVTSDYSDASDSEYSAAGNYSDASSTFSEESSAENSVESIPDDLLNSFSQEFHYSVRYFKAIFDSDGTLITLDTAHIISITDETAEAYAVRAYSSRSEFGHIGYFYYLKDDDGEGLTHIIYLNCTSQVESNTRIMEITLIIAGAGALIAFIFIYMFSYRVIQPEIENVRRQKQFITNASHELKTPLAVIRANTEIEEMMNGENEWTQSTMRQVDRLNGLIANLVMISRAQEKEDRSSMAEIDVTKAVSETIEPYSSLAQQEKKEFDIRLEDGVKMTADESKIRQLASLLIDNAFKYCDDKGIVRAALDTQKKGKIVRLVISNTYADGANVDYSKFFDRFYREDKSHNVDKGGYGIGLSIAESICQQYGGSITASWKDGEISFSCLLPA